MHCAVDLYKLIFILRGEMKQKARWVLFRGVLLNLSGCFPFCAPILSSVCSIHLSTHTHTHKQTQNDGLLPAPQGSLDPCTRLNLTLMTDSDRGRKYRGWGWGRCRGEGEGEGAEGGRWGEGGVGYVWSDRLIMVFLRKALFSYLLRTRRPHNMHKSIILTQVPIEGTWYHRTSNWCLPLLVEME